MPASRISVEITGDPVGLQAAASKAVEALNALADRAVKAGQATASQGERTTKANQAVADSFRVMAGSADRANTSIIDSTSMVAKAVRDAALAQDDAASQVIAAAQRMAVAQERVGVAARESAGVQRESADVVIRANDEAASSTTRASERQVLGYRSAAGESEKSAARTRAAFGARNSELTKAGRTLTAGVLAGAAASVYAAGKYQELTTRYITQAGASKQATDQIRQGLLSMAGQVGETPNKLAEAMYHVVSSMNAILPAQHRVTDELHIMRIAAEGAQIGGSDLEETTYALASAMNALHAPASQAKQVMGELNAIVGAGDMTMSDLLDSLKSGLIPEARVFHVSLQSLGAALAAMGDQGMRGARAGTRLRMSLALLGAPTKQATTILDTLGLSHRQVTQDTNAMSLALQKAGVQTTQMAYDMRQPDGIQVALNDLDNHLRNSGLSAEQAGAVISRAFGGGRMGATIAMLAQSTDRLQIKYQQIGHTVASFDSDVVARGHNVTMMLDQTWASVNAGAISLGDMLIPQVKDAVHDLADMAQWLDKNRGAAAALGAAVTALGTVAIASYLTSKVRGVTTALGEMYGALHRGPGAAATATASTATGAAGAGVSTLTGLGIGGARSGMGLPGSMVNPIVVAIEANENTGLGSYGAPIAADNAQVARREMGTVATVEGGAASNLITRETTGAAGSATLDAGLLASLRGGGSVALRALGRGGLIAGAGYMASQVAGGIIGGKTGHTVAGLGGAMSAGAGVGAVGMAIPGVDAFVNPLTGAIAGAAIYGLTHLFSSRSFQDKLATQLTGRVAQIPTRHETQQQAAAVQTAAQLQSHVSHLVGQARAIQGQIVRYDTPGGSFGDRVLPLTAKQRQQQDALYSQAGQLAAQGIQGQLQTFAHIDPSSVINDFVSHFKNVAPAMRDAAAQSMLAWAHGMEQEGKLPANAVKTIIDQLKHELPGLRPAFAQAGISSVQGLTASLQFDAAKQNVTQFINSMASQWSSMPPMARNAGEGIEQNITTQLEYLHEKARTSTGQTKTDALENFHQLQTLAVAYVSQMAGAINTQMQQISQVMGSGSSQARSLVLADFQQIASGITASMQAGAIGVKNGIAQINRELDQALQAMGLTRADIKQYIGTNLTAGQAAQLASQTASGQTQNLINQAQGRASGGYVGAPGERGGDTVPAMLGRGEAVLNHQQQSVVNSALAGSRFGSLDGVFAATAGSRHYMASGGIAGGGRSAGALTAMEAKANEIAAQHYAYEWGGGHNAAFAPSHGSGHGSGPGIGYDCSGAVSAVLHAGGVLGTPDVASEFMTYGLPGPGVVTIYASPTHTFMSLAGRFFGTHGTSGAGWYAGGPMPGFTVRHAPLGAAGMIGGGAMIATPAVHVPGVAGALAHSALAGLAGADNQAVSAAMMALGLGGSGAYGTGDIGTMPNAGNWQQALRQIASQNGWSAADWLGVVSLESGGNPNARNASGAYGLGQFLGSTATEYAPYGALSSDPVAQIVAMAHYIKDRYGNPTAALAHEHAYHWYATGGIAGRRERNPRVLRPPRASTSHPRKIKAPTAKGHSHTSKIAGHFKIPASYGSLAAIMPQAASMINDAASYMSAMGTNGTGGLLGLIGALSSLTNQTPTSSLVARREFGDSYRILPALASGYGGDMQYLQPQLDELAKLGHPLTLAPGMTYTQAYDAYQANVDQYNTYAQSAASGDSTAQDWQTTLGNVKTILDWIGSDGDHRMITASDIAMLQYYKVPGLSWGAPGSVSVNAQAKFVNEMAENENNAATATLSKLNSQLTQAIGRYRQRQQSTLRLEQSQYRHVTKLQAALRGLTRLGLVRNLRDAQGAYRRALAHTGIEDVVASINDELASERSKSSPDKTYIRYLTDLKTRYGDDARRLSVVSDRAVTSARLALTKNDINNQLRVAEDALFTLGGSRTAVGRPSSGSSVYGMESHALSVLANTISANSTNIGTAQGQMPQILGNLQNLDAAIGAGFDTSTLQALPAASSTTSSSTDTTLLQELLQQMATYTSEAQTLQTVQLSALQSFGANVPGYEHGVASVPYTGLALLHQGETVVPNPNGPYSAGTIGRDSPDVHVHLTAGGELAPLIRLIDSRVSHPSNVLRVSRQIGHRASIMPAGLGGRS